jgi:dihydroorotase
MNDYRNSTVNAQNVSAAGETYRFPAAVDLFTRCGALGAAELALKVRQAGYGCAVLYPEREICTLRELRAERLLSGNGGVLMPLPSAAKEDGAMAEIGLMSRGGEKLFCLPDGFSSLRRLRNLFCYAADFGCRIAVLPCLRELCENGQISAGPSADRLGMKSMPSSAESLAVEICLQLAAEWNTPLHLRGLTCRRSVEEVRRAKKAGQNVTCDVPAANLMFDDSVYTVENLKGSFRLFPVLRGAADRAALWDALDSGVIDAVVSNHCARSADDLALPFEEMPFGSERMENVLSGLMDAWEAQKRPCRTERLIDALSFGPRRILGGEAKLPDGSTVLRRGENGWQAFYEIQG